MSNALITLGVAVLAGLTGYVVIGRKPNARFMDERTLSIWRQRAVWLLQLYLGISLVLCMIFLFIHINQIPVWDIMQYLLWTTVFSYIVLFVSRRN
ncbi:hypothetical protein [Alicyclobacillus fastidiosus]|uniref:hypothetical protein n=1 Tax=Alicyclobacillus fastidiosus TaxID=392011 RepID=UPI0023EA3D22|nr:hypothetical protein [Alicyclobacillus fastidiosus]GMA63077.1 hypothetical protein GCM10025859_35170 [Alicyclobacillus fastidiosus]